MLHQHAPADGRPFTGADLVQEFLTFVENQPRQSLTQLMARTLRKSRLLTFAEAGTIFLVRRAGSRAFLRPLNVQNERIRVRRSDFEVPVGPGTIAGYVAASGETVRIDDVYDIPQSRPYTFNPANEHPRYTTRSMLCFPLKNYEEKVIGVVQLINCLPPGANAPRPFEPEMANLVVPVARFVSTSIERTDMLDKIRRKNADLRERNRLLEESKTQIAALQAETEDAFRTSVTLLARAAEIHDEETGNHILRVNEYSYFVARKLGLADAFCEEIRYSAALHDVGKMSVDQAVLKKTGRLDAQERAEMDRHTIYGHMILSESSRLSMAAEIALHHHEKWDGTGYPHQLAGEAIPVSARIVQIADVYDALRSERPYKRGFSHDEAVQIMTDGDDRLDPAAQFDPRILSLFRHHHEEFDAIWQRLRD